MSRRSAIAPAQVRELLSDGRGRTVLGTLTVYLLLAGAALVFLVPILWMVSTSLKANESVFDLPITWVPKHPLWGNYPAAYNAADFTHYFRNSAIVTGSVTLLGVTLSTLAGYGLAKYRFVGRTALLVLILATLMLPIEVIMIPLYLTVQQFGWLNTYEGLIVPVAANAIGVLVMRQYFLSLPDELIAAARVDGASHLRTFFQIAVPLAWPAILTVAVLTFQATWDDFVWPFLIISSSSKATVPLAVQTFESAETSNFPYLMAVSTIACLPLTLFFLVFQRQFIRGVATLGLRQ